MAAARVVLSDNMRWLQYGPGGVPGGDPPKATAAGGTHPTGMHSCFHYFL